MKALPIRVANAQTHTLNVTFMTTLKVVTINVARTTDLKRSIKEAEKLEPDILCLQELRQNRTDFSSVGITATGTNKSELAKASKKLETNACIIMLYDSVGILIYNSELNI